MEKRVNEGVQVNSDVNYDQVLSSFDNRDVAKEKKKRLLLHSCCGPCSTACIERLVSDFKITVFYYNPNITDRDEYEKRRENQILFIKKFNECLDEEDKIDFLEGDYLPEEFFNACGHLKDEPEGGKRCTECFKLRLERAAMTAKNTGHPIFGTTLTVSPHKNYPLISSIGNHFAKVYGVEFLDVDFKKKDGYRRSVELSKEYELYRQNYCGCEYSKWFNK